MEIFQEIGKNRCLIVLSEKNRLGIHKAFLGILGNNNPDFCCEDTVSALFLAEDCEPISEEKAREIHPNLFKNYHEYERLCKILHRGSEGGACKTAKRLSQQAALV